MMDESTFATLASASHELFVACDEAGVVLYADGRARRLLGTRPGDPLGSLVAPGCAEKLADFLARGVLAPVDSCEIPFVVGGKPLAVSLSSTPHAAGLLVVGHVLPEGFAAALNQVSAMVAESVELNRAMLAQRNEIAQRHAELLRVNAELSESHQGVLSLHRELQERSDQTRQDNEIKTRLVAHLSHELRTPIHSILGLTDLLMSSKETALAPDQTKQVRFIKASADEVLGMVNDVLDLARLDAGHAQIRVDRFALDDFVASMRGVLRPLLPPNAPTELVIEDVPEGIELETDRTKLSQIVRNLVSNALKFTERGEVRARLTVRDGRLAIRISDTGIGIADTDLSTIFEEYGQIGGDLQDRVKGTGLGLPLSVRLAERLGGTITVESEVGVGSTFIVDVPKTHEEARAMHGMLKELAQRDEPAVGT